MTVYRIQSKRDRTHGAYWVLAFPSSYFTRDIKRPMPEEDIGIEREMKPEEYCGFASASALLRWFGGAIPKLLEKGAEIVALCNVTVTAIGEYQVLFTWND